MTPRPRPITAPAGMEIVSLRQNDVMVSEAAFAASAPLRSGRVYTEISGSVNTGVGTGSGGPVTAGVGIGSGGSVMAGVGTGSWESGSEGAGAGRGTSTVCGRL